MSSMSFQLQKMFVCSLTANPSVTLFSFYEIGSRLYHPKITLDLLRDSKHSKQGLYFTLYASDGEPLVCRRS